MTHVHALVAWWYVMVWAMSMTANIGKQWNAQTNLSPSSSLGLQSLVACES